MSDAPEMPNEIWAYSQWADNCDKGEWDQSENPDCGKDWPHARYVKQSIHTSLALDALAAETQAADAYAAQLKAEAIAAKLAEALRAIAKTDAESFLLETKVNGMTIQGGARYCDEADVRQLIKSATAALAEYEASK